MNAVETLQKYARSSTVLITKPITNRHPGSKIVDDLGSILFAHAAQAWANIGHALGNALGDDNIGPGSDRVRKQYWAKFGATRGQKGY